MRRPILRPVVLLVLTMTLTGAAQLPDLLAADRSAIGELLVRNPTTGEEGAGLQVASYGASISIHGRVAETTVEQVFANPGAQQLEGTFYFPLPAGASLSRFAMEIDGKLMEGEIVERRRGRAIYEDIVRSMKDPALLEMTQGNTFKARVFPIPAQGQKRIVLAFTQELAVEDGAITYTLPLLSEAFTRNQVGEVTIEVQARQAGGYSGVECSFEGPIPTPPCPEVHLRWEQRGAPRGDLRLALTPQLAGAAALEVAPAALSGDPGYLCLRTPPPRIEAGYLQQPKVMVILVDTSASVTREELEGEITILADLLQALEPQDRVAVMAFDQRPEVLTTEAGAVAPSRVDGAAVAARLHERGSLGGSDLMAALQKAQEILVASPAAPTGDNRCIVLLGDALATLGETDPAPLLETLRATGARFLPVAVGSQHNRSLLRVAARQGRGRLTVAIPGTDLSRVGQRILELATEGALLTGLEATVRCSDGTTSTIPLDNVAPGDEISFTGRFTGLVRDLAIEVHGALEGAPFTLTCAGSSLPVTDSPRLPRLWAAAQLDELLARPQTAETRAEIIALSEAHRIMTPYTVFLVLETEEAYREHLIARRSREAPREQGGGGPGRSAGRERSAAPGGSLEEEANGDAGPGEEAELALELLDQLSEHQDGIGGGLSDDYAEDLELEGGERLEGLGLAFGDGEEELEEMGGLRFRWGAGGEGAVPAPALPPGARPEEPAGEQPERLVEESRAVPAADDKSVETPVGRAVAVIPREALPTVGLAFTPGGDATLQAATPFDPEALRQAQSAVDREPRSRAARQSLGLALLAAGELDQAISWSRDWISIDPRNLTPYLHMGKALARKGAAEHSLRAFTSLVDVRPGEAQAHRILGRLLVNQGLLDEARSQFEKAMEDRPDDPSGLQDLAQLAIAAGEFPRAVDLFATLAERDWPEHHGPIRDLARQQLGLLYLRLEGRALTRGQTAEGAEWARKRAALPDEHFKPRDVKVLINWDTAGTDVDLWVHGPDGVKCFYSQRQTPMGGNLYADITTGFGPEIYYLDQAAYGEYEVKVHYYSAGESDDTHVRALVVLFEGAQRQEIHEVDLTLHQKDDVALVARFTLTPPE